MDAVLPAWRMPGFAFVLVFTLGPPVIRTAGRFDAMRRVYAQTRTSALDAGGPGLPTRHEA
jgi:hypothetical protein